jgi:hypothetical protein
MTYYKVAHYKGRCHITKGRCHITKRLITKEDDILQERDDILQNWKRTLYKIAIRYSMLSSQTVTKQTLSNQQTLYSDKTDSFHNKYANKTSDTNCHRAERPIRLRNGAEKWG